MKQNKFKPVPIPSNIFTCFEQDSFVNELKQYQKREFENNREIRRFVDFLSTTLMNNPKVKNIFLSYFETKESFDKWIFGSIDTNHEKLRLHRDAFIENEYLKYKTKHSSFWFDKPNMLYLKSFFVYILSCACFETINLKFSMEDEIQSVLESIALD